MAALGAVTLLTMPGAFLFERFHLAAFYIPGILFTGASLLKAGKLPRRTLVTLWFSPAVFLTLAIALQVAAGRTSILVVRVLIEVLGRFPAAALFFLLFALEIIGMVKLARFNRTADNVLFNFGELRLKFLAVLTFLGLMEPNEEEKEEKKMEAERQEPGDVERPAMPLPQFPEPPSSLKTAALLRRVLTDGGNDRDEENPETKPPAEVPFEEDPAFEFLGKTSDEDSALAEDSSDEETEFVVIEPKEPLGKTHKEYEVPIEGLLENYPDANFSSIDEATRQGAEILEQTLKEFRIEARVTGIQRGPVITMYELLPSPGVKISSIVSLQDNIALRLAASRVRIVAPIPGKHAIGIEVPNKKRSIVSFSSLVKSGEFRNSGKKIPVILGEDISGGSQIIDLTRTPHLLIAGATGSGKSVCVNSLIASILYSRNHQEVKMIMVDPKIVELKHYNDIPHLLTPVITEPKKALQALQWCLCEMERRYSLLDSQGVRDVSSYNKRVIDRNLATTPLPYIVVIIDEFADLMATSGKELEGIVARLAAMSRAVGIHLVLATQRPSVDVITGLIKANFPSRIAFMVAGKTDSRIIIDTMGAEKLLGKGDMLFTSAWNPFPSRMQGAFLAEEEVERMANYVKTLGEPDYIDEEMFFDEEDGEDFQLESGDGDDPMYEKALEIVVSSRKASASYLQRRLKIGYNRAARLVEEMEHRGIVGPANGSKPRDIIHIPEQAERDRPSA